jgi:WD domain, G-beta repeat/NB-ARC domain
MDGHVAARITTPQQLETELHHALVELLRDWPTTVEPTRGPYLDRPPPFMAPELPDPHVERRELMSRVIGLLDAPPRTVGLWGDAGSGKRMLAASVCHQVRDRFPGGILWVTLGENVASEEALVRKINDLAATLSGRRPDYAGPEAAGAHLGGLLEQASRLLVLDDVRDADQLAPFLRGRCMRLITTRVRAILPEAAVSVSVGPMSEAEALELLMHGVDAEGAAELDELARRTGGSPYLVRIVRRAVRYRRELGASLALAAAHVEACLPMGQAPASDPALEAASLRLLEDGRPDRLECYLQLAALPEDVDVPLATLSRWWGMDEPETARQCRELANAGLIEDRDDAWVRVHGVLRVGQRRLAGYHRALLNAHRAGLPRTEDGLRTAWWEMSQAEPYLWEHLDHHLHEAGRDGGPEGAELEALLGDERWRRARALRVARDAVLEGHGGRVRTVAISPDGSWLASGDAAGSVRLWSSLDGSPRATFSSHSGAVNSLAIAPDGSWLASASSDNVVRLWKVADGSCRTLIGHSDDGVNAVAISPDGSWLASAGMDGTVRLWDAADGSNLATAHGHAGPVRAVAISPNGPWLVSAGDDWIVLRRTRDAETLRTLDRSMGVRQTLAISPDGSWLACLGRNATVRVLNVNGSLRATIPGHAGGVNAVAISPDGSWLATAGRDGTVHLWSTEDGSARATLTGHVGSVNAVAIAPNASWLASAGDDQTVRLWRVP